MERALVQYFARMCDRCTPFGLFAGVSVGEVGSETRLRLAGRERYRRRSALDLAQVFRLVGTLIRDGSVRASLRYRPNDTLAKVGSGYQYVEASSQNGDARHKIAFLEEDDALVAALDEARGGATLPELSVALAERISDPEVGAADIAEYLDDLIEAQVIEPELIPAVVGEDPLDQILKSLEVAPELSDSFTRVRRLRTELDRLDTHGAGAPPEAYTAVNAVWTEELGLEKTDRLLQVDMFKEAAELRLSGDVVEEVLRGAEPLGRLAGPLADPLRDLKNRFRERYGSREVPLAEAFDPERGLGAPGPDLQPRIPVSPLLAGLDIGPARGHREVDVKGSFSEVLANRLFGPGAEVPMVLELDDDLLDRLAVAEPGLLPDALGIHFELLAVSEEAVRNGDFRILLHGAAGPSGARMLGRFCDLDPFLFDKVCDHLRDEEALAPDEVYAEVVHSPEGRIGNVVRRPRIRETELSWIGHSGCEMAQRLTVADLVIRLDGHRFQLLSRRDGKSVRPRLTSAHNYRRSSGMYRFLCALQNDGTRPGFGWGWGSLNGLPFLPRVFRGRTVYALARWKVGRERAAYKAIGTAKTEIARDDAIRQLARELGLPRFIRLRDGDNRLLLDLENPLCLAVLADHAARRRVLILEETLTDDLEGCVSGPEGKYRNEIILPLVRKEPVAAFENTRRTRRSAGTALSLQRTFPPGGEWLFFKFYALAGTADRLLSEIVAPLAALHEEVAPGEPWFFIRYSDPEQHLRVRFRGGREVRRALEDRATSLVRPLVESGSVHRVTLDTYVREIERYGGDRGIELAEMWFGHDSAAVLRLGELLEAAADESLRWKAAAMGFDRLLADFGLDYEGRERVVSAARESFGRQFNVGLGVRRRLAHRLRAQRPELEALVTGSPENDAPVRRLDGILRERSGKTENVVSELRSMAEAGNLECPLDDVLRSLTHMHANRMFPVSARAHELVIHDFLSRTYHSLQARRSR